MVQLAADGHDPCRVQPVVGVVGQEPAGLLSGPHALAAFGLVPRAVVVGWMALVALLLLGEFGPLFELDQWVMNISPYAHVPRLPGGDFSAIPLVWLVGVAAALTVAGLFGFRRRDVPVS